MDLIEEIKKILKGEGESTINKDPIEQIIDMLLEWIGVGDNPKE